ncbi:hypothetical protein LCGC14_1438090 [marine sediment metagenome]|uniref:Uncharacterized protein n=1 Tax=marine sediment metagenome TaxID=412755 RepID=A0A0F9JM30_9ZZZZ
MPKWTRDLGGKTKSLADGQLAASKGTLYTTPTGKQAIATVKLVNTSGSTVKVNLYFKASGGTSRRIIGKDVPIEENGHLIMDDDQSLEAGDILEGDATFGTTVDYTVSGKEIT